MRYNEIRLNEYIDSDAYGWWLDSSGTFREVPYQGHANYIKNNGITLDKHLTYYAWAYDNEWVRLVTSYSPYLNARYVGIVGTIEAVKKQAEKILSVAKNYDIAEVELVKSQVLPDKSEIINYSLIKGGTQEFKLPSEMNKFRTALRSLSPFITEASRIGTSIHKREIPAEFKHLPILGIGTTSVVLEKDPDTVIMLTKDPIKKDWLVNELGIATMHDWHDTYHPKLKDMPIYILEMPRLYPLGPKTRKAARDLVKLFTKINSDATSKNRKTDILNLFYKHFDEYNKNNTNEHALLQLVNFLMNYNTDQYEWDIRMGNFMQDKDENLVILDPIVDREIFDIFSKRNTSYW